MNNINQIKSSTLRLPLKRMEKEKSLNHILEKNTIKPDNNSGDNSPIIATHVHRKQVKKYFSQIKLEPMHSKTQKNSPDSSPSNSPLLKKRSLKRLPKRSAF